MVKGKIDILGLGISTIDDFLIVEDFPKPNGKQPVVRKERQLGGLTAVALVAAARLGCRCTYAISLGKGDLSRFARETLKSEKITLLENSDSPDAEPCHSIIITEQGTGERSILWDDSLSLHPPLTEDVEALAMRAGCLYVDHVFAADILPLSRKARQAGIELVGDFERIDAPSRELLEVTSHVIIPIGFAPQAVNETLPDEAVRALLRTPGRELACVTDSERGCWYGTADHPEKVIHQPAFSAEKVVDSTGCGDVFHGVYAASLVQGYEPAERIRRAAAAACLKIGVQGAMAGAPTKQELDDFLAKA